MSKRDPWTGRAIPVVFLGPRRGFALPFLSLPGEPPNPPAPNRSQSSRSPPIHPTPTIITHPPSPGPASLSPPSPSSSSAFYYSSPLISFWLLLVGSLLASCENPPHPQGDDTHTERGKGRRGRGRQPQWARHKRSGGRTHARDSPEIQDPRDPLALVASQSPERIRVHGGRRGARRVL
jgi:hypothetical protein